ncbi:MAG: ACP S-malonyltransferase [Verrucomicrobia bacterium]|nr:ACP S-malonyltransferase [Verrucomicrobiota bacterium]
MSKKIAFLFPGQGAQYPGMGKDFYDAYPVAAKTFHEADQHLGYPLSKLIFEGPADELTETRYSQLAIFVTSIAILRVVQELFPELEPTACAGLSLGEYTALVAAGILSFTECLDLVRLRGEAMQAACEEKPGTMQVVLGMTEEAVDAALSEMVPPQPVWIANLNCPGQVVIAGTLEAMPSVADHLKKNGAKRVLPLDVSGAFHSQLMGSAQDQLRKKIAPLHFAKAATEIVMNVPGESVEAPEAIKQALIDQVVSPVRWEKGIRALASSAIELYIEMGPGKTLSGMNKRIGIAEPTLSVEKVTDLEGLTNYMRSLYATVES